MSKVPFIFINKVILIKIYLIYEISSCLLVKNDLIE